MEESKFSDIIIHFLLMILKSLNQQKQFFLNNFHLGVVVWKLINSYASVFNPENIENYYRDRYEDDYPGYQIALKELKRLSAHCKKEK